MLTRIDRRRRGFTMVELLVVITIIGLLLTFILVASRDALRTANEKATLSLITKLETGLNERLEAILAQRGDVTLTHKRIAASYIAGATDPVESNQRAQVIAQFDQVRAELPDFFVLTSIDNPALSGTYPLNFGGLPYPASGTGLGNFVLPLGQGIAGGGVQISTDLTVLPPATSGTGIFGASYTAAAGIYKNLGYLQAGYDGADNNANGLVDEFIEGTGGNAARASEITARLALHTHNTARSEMLYALLVEGQGPLGSVFSPDDFTSNEVKDTDGDGLPEFVDAWGEPLQFYRWPIYFNPTATGSATAYIQKGIAPYAAIESRQQDPLDPSQLLMAPSWWWSQVNAGTPNADFSSVGSLSAGAVSFMTYFHSLADPNPNAPTWDRAGFLPTRAYYSRPLVISSGPDKQLGIYQFGVNYRDDRVPSSLDLGSGFDGTGAPIAPTVANCLHVESGAVQIDAGQITTSGPFGALVTFPGTANDTTRYLSGSAGLDDISNQALSSPGGGVR